MQEVSRLKKSLNKLLELLKKEKEALIVSDADLVIDVLNKKMNIVQELESMDLKSITTSEPIKSLVKEILDIQEINLLLTKQALNYQQNLMESIVNSSASTSSVYSENGEYNKRESINLVNQTI